MHSIQNKMSQTYRYTLYVYRDAVWTPIQIYELTDSEIQGIYSSQLLSKTQLQLNNILLLSSPTASDPPPETTQSLAYNMRLENLTWFSKSWELMPFHIITTYQYSTEIAINDNDPFEYAISFHSITGIQKNLVKIVASNLNEFMNGFLTYYRLLHTYSRVPGFTLFDIWKLTSENKLELFASMSTLQDFVFNYLPLEIQASIISYIPKEFRYLNKYYNEFTDSIMPLCERAPYYFVKRELIRRLQNKYDTEKILAIIPKNYDNMVLKDRVDILKLALYSNATVFKYLLDRIPNLRVKYSLDNDDMSIETALIGAISTIGFIKGKDNILESTKYLFTRPDLELTDIDVSRLLEGIPELVSLILKSVRSLDRTIFSGNHLSSDAIRALNKHPDFDPSMNNYALVYTIIEQKDPITLMKILENPKVDPSANNNEFLRRAILRGNPHWYSRIIREILNNPRLDLSRNDYSIINDIQELAPNPSEIFREIISITTDPEALRRILELNSYFNMEKQSYLVETLIKKGGWKILESFILEPMSRLSEESKYLLALQPQGKVLLELYNNNLSNA